MSDWWSDAPVLDSKEGQALAARPADNAKPASDGDKWWEAAPVASTHRETDQPTPQAPGAPIKLYSPNPDAPKVYGAPDDAKPRPIDQPPEVKESTVAPKSQGAGLNFTARAYESLAHLLGIPADMGAALVAPKLWQSMPEEKKQQFRDESPRQASFMDWLSDTSQHPSLGSEWWKKAFERAGAKIDEVQPTTPSEHIAGAAGGAMMDMAGLGMSAEVMVSRALREAEAIMKSMDGVLPSASRAPTTIGQMVRGQGTVSNAAMGAAAGATGEFAAENAPEPLKPTARVAGELLGGSPVAAGSTFFDRLFKSARETAGRLIEGPEMSAARRIEDAAANPEKFRADVSNAAAESAPVAGSEPTTFQATGDLGVGALERKAASGSDYGVQSFADRRTAQNNARVEAIAKLSDAEADPSVVADYVRTRLADLTDLHASRVKTATQGVTDRLAVAGGEMFDNPAAYGEALRGPMTELHQRAKDEASALWRAIDPDMSAPVNVENLKETVADLIGKIPAIAKPPSGEEASIATAIGRLPEDADFGTLVALRSRLTDAMRDERRSGTPTALRRLGIMLRQVDDTLAEAAAGVAADPTKGPAMLRRLESDARTWESTTGEAGVAAREATAAPSREHVVPDEPSVVGSEPHAATDRPRGELREGDEGLAAVQEGGLPSAPGTEGAQGRGPRVSPGDSGLQEPPGATFTQDVADRYAAARGATRDLKQTFENGPVGQILRPAGERGFFRMTSSNVARTLFDNPERLQAFADAVKSEAQKSPKEAAAAIETMRDYAAFSMRKAAVRDGMISQPRLDRWVDDHGYVFDQFPSLRAKFADARAAQDSLDEAIANQKQALREFQDSAATNFLDGRTPQVAAGQAIKNPEEFGRLVDLVKGDPTALAGLKRATIDYMMAIGRGTGTAEAGTSGVSQINAATLQKTYSANRKSLEKLFDAKELTNMERVIADLRMANRSIVALKTPGGSNTAQDTSGRAWNALQRIITTYGGRALGAAGGETLGGHTGGVAGFVAGSAVDAYLANRAAAIDNAVVDMLLDRKMAALWLSRIPESGAESWKQQFARRLRALTANEVADATDREGTPAGAAVRVQVSEARDTTNINPTDGQKEAGNYLKGRVSFHGLPFVMENPEGSIRRGVDADGKPWEAKLPADYGYLSRTEGADGDHVDAYIGPDHASQRAWVIDQVDPETGKFDEHKVILGVSTEAAARDIYERAFSDGSGPQRLGNVTAMSLDQLKTWLADGDTKKPAGKVTAQR